MHAPGTPNHEMTVVSHPLFNKQELGALSVQEHLAWPPMLPVPPGDGTAGLLSPGVPHQAVLDP